LRTEPLNEADDKKAAKQHRRPADRHLAARLKQSAVLPGLHFGQLFVMS
jgi:hypothetical protein